MIFQKTNILLIHAAVIDDEYPTALEIGLKT